MNIELSEEKYRRMMALLRAARRHQVNRLEERFDWGERPEDPLERSEYDMLMGQFNRIDEAYSTIWRSTHPEREKARQEKRAGYREKYKRRKREGIV